MRHVAILLMAVLAWQLSWVRGQGNERTGDETPKGLEMLIDAETLERRLDDPVLRILDARPADAYAESHIPGAVHVDVARWARLALSDGGLQDAAAWSKLVGALGIGRDTPVVVYGERLPDVGRVWWTLKYLGVQQVAILDGGWPVWSAAMRPASDAVPKAAAVDFQPELQTDRLEEIDSLKKTHTDDDVVVIDTRSADEYTGREVRGARGGRIPGSTHLEWSDLLADDGRFKPRDKMLELFKSHGITPDKTAITC